MFEMIKIAIKNTMRNKRRTILTEIMIVVGVVMILFTSAFLQGMSDNWKNSIVNASTGHFQIMKEGYKEHRASFALDYPITGVSLLVSKLNKEPDVLSVTPQISIGGLISTGQKTSPFFGSGVVIDKLTETLPSVYNNLEKGKPLSLDRKGGAILGFGLAKILGVKIGDFLMLAGYDRYNAMNAVNISVVGIVNIPEDAVNDRLVITDYSTAKSLVAYEDEATEIVVRTRDFSRLDPIINGLKNKYAQKNKIEFYPWFVLAGSFSQVSGMFKAFSAIIGFIVYITVMVGLSNTILMGVFERTQEIGTLMAMGSSRLRVMWMFILESIWMGIIGVFIGVILYAIILIVLSGPGIVIPPPPGASKSIILHLAFNWRDVFSVAFSIILVTIIGAIYPSRFASKLNPIDSIRSNQ